MAAPSISLKARALRYLSMREHSRLELTRKLARYAQPGDDIAALLDWLQAAKFLSQDRFAEALVHRRAARYGNSRILLELQSHGIDDEALQAVKSGLTADDEIARAQAVWQKKFGQFPQNIQERARQIRFLMQRGFSQRAIQGVVGRSDNPQEE